MVELQKLNNNKEVVSDEMMLLLILNTASIEIIPMTTIALRATYGSTNPAAIVLPTIIASFSATIFGVVAVKILSRSRRKS